MHHGKHSGQLTQHVQQLCWALPSCNSPAASLPLLSQLKHPPAEAARGAAEQTQRGYSPNRHVRLPAAQAYMDGRQARAVVVVVHVRLRSRGGSSAM